MIKVEMHGRLGNQLFQYAAARALQEQTGQKIIISFRQVNGRNSEGKIGWEDSLKYFHVKQYQTVVTKKSLLYYKSNLWVSFIGTIYYFLYKGKTNDINDLYNFQRKFCPILDRYGIRWLANGYFSFKNNTAKDFFLNGSFESEEYFNQIRPALLQEFTPKEKPLSSNDWLYKKIKEKNSVCLSIRHFKLKKGKNMMRDVCSKAYYNSAIEIMKKKIKDPMFIIFSDDIGWVKKNFNFDNCKYVFESKDNPIWEKLRLMYSCSNFIIPNSTFGWWAQYLCENPKKIVISPQKWFNNDFKSPLIKKDWIRIDENGKVIA
ncbi:alpha-1,2-fucosyltransferase [Limosilactobacillus mucosae]|uniref:alpha-1,2-fucosyltransferase n=1 Tax=Limosilactobacillus mucosae TaxID=97478 RepID=UPI003EBEB077